MTNEQVDAHDIIELLERVVEHQRTMAAQLRNALDQCENLRALATAQQAHIDRLEAALRGQQATIEALAGPVSASGAEVH